MNPIQISKNEIVFKKQEIEISLKFDKKLN